jgi:hypothetical protein
MTITSDLGVDELARVRRVRAEDPGAIRAALAG